MSKLHLSTLKYTGVHRFIDLSNRKCDIGSFPSGSAVGPSGNILLFSPQHPLEICTSRLPTPPGTSSNLPWGSYGYFLELHI